MLSDSHSHSITLILWVSGAHRVYRVSKKRKEKEKTPLVVMTQPA